MMNIWRELNMNIIVNVKMLNALRAMEVEHATQIVYFEYRAILLLQCRLLHEIYK